MAETGRRELGFERKYVVDAGDVFHVLYSWNDTPSQRSSDPSSDSVLALTEGERQFLAALVELGVPFLVVGVGSAALQGARVVTEDLDL